MPSAYAGTSTACRTMNHSCSSSRSTSLGTVIHIPSYWSLDPKRDIRWDAISAVRSTVRSGHSPATTSLGQEGLAFHVWCRHLLHWDLSHSPLDLEQREGRIQRFGGLSTRTVLAKQLRAAVLADNTVRKSPWQTPAEMAETASMSDSSGLSPWWGCDSEAIERHIVS
jgi:hypothetical protein